MTTIREYLLGLAKDLHARDRNPIVAIDCIAAKKRAEVLERIAAEVEGRSENEALSILKEYRARYAAAANEPTGNGIGWVFTMSEANWFDGVADRVARDNTGWIEVSSTGYDHKSGRLLNLPAYSRKLAVNHDVAYIARGRDEADEVWLARRAEWLAAYHPDVRIAHAQSPHVDGVPEDFRLGTVASFVEIEHLVEANILPIKGWRLDDGGFLELVEAFAKPREDGVIALARQKEGAERPLGRMSMPHYDIELVA
jgi:hypothetical protein